MGLLSNLGLGTARRLRSQLGARGALRVLAPMIASSDPSTARAGAIVVAMECAIELGDSAALEELALFWSVEPAPAATGDIEKLCARLVASGEGARALHLADAEVQRHDGWRARWLRAIAHETAGSAVRAIADWREAARRASDPQVARAARIELTRVLASRPESRLEAARLATEIADGAGTATLSPRARLVLATARLAETGRYARVASLDALIGLAADPDPAIARVAVRVACAHADDMGAAATAIELERVGSALSCWTDERERACAKRVLDAIAEASVGDAAGKSASLVRAAAVDPSTSGALDRARAVLSGDAPGPRGGAAWAPLAAIAAMRRGRDEEARERLRELRAEPDARSGEPWSAPWWTAAWMALDRPPLRREGVALASVLLGARGAPPRGFSHLATHLERAGALPEARRALARAQESREPGARERRIAALLRAGWEAAKAGRRDDALALLGEAKAA